MKYLNIGCGNIFHSEWVNIDSNSSEPGIISHNILKGLPFQDNQFEIIYFSQLLEHIPKERTSAFLKDCFRVMKPGGIIRIVVPDLENIVNEYKKLLKANLAASDPISEANYDWILLEMYDQTVRNENGGQMGVYLSQPKIINSEFLISRIGKSYENIRTYYLSNSQNKNASHKTSWLRRANFIKILKLVSLRNILVKILLTKEEKRSLDIGLFRNAGEIHYWMYDQYSLKKAIEGSGFISVKKKSPFESYVEKWSKYELDAKNEKAYSPTSLFMEGIKPI